jgi:hypothetical protein
MSEVKITGDAASAVRAASIHEFDDNGMKQVENRFVIQVKQETYDRVKKAALPGETFSDTIQRLCVLFLAGGKPN